MTLTDQEYIDAVRELVSQAEEFAPFALLNEDGDCVEFFVSQKNYYSKRVDHYLTLYLEEGTNELAGFVIKHITQILKRVIAQNVAYRFVVRNEEIRLEALFTAMSVEREIINEYHILQEYLKVADLIDRYNLNQVKIAPILEKLPQQQST